MRTNGDPYNVFSISATEDSYKRFSELTTNSVGVKEVTTFSGDRLGDGTPKQVTKTYSSNTDLRYTMVENRTFASNSDTLVGTGTVVTVAPRFNFDQKIANFTWSWNSRGRSAPTTP
jgi:hypothetical protein